MPRPPFEKQMGNWPVLPWQAFLPFPKKKQGGNRFREMRLGMSKRKNEVVFTLIQERQSPKSSASFSSFPLVVGKAPCLSQMCYIPHEE
jgi:hypothetical protein